MSRVCKCLAKNDEVGGFISSDLKAITVDAFMQNRRPGRYRFTLGRFCSSKCRAAAWQAKREYALARLEENLSHALAQVQAIRERRTRPGAMPTEARSGSWSKHQTAGE